MNKYAFIHCLNTNSLQLNLIVQLSPIRVKIRLQSYTPLSKFYFVRIKYFQGDTLNEIKTRCRLNEPSRLG